MVATPWTPDRMITRERVHHVAASLFPAEAATGEDCMMEAGSEGEPCRICAARNAQWALRLELTRRAMFEAFGYRP